jgi:predicted ATPase
MKLDYLKIDKFKNLHNFEIDFDQKSQTTVLVGRNGSGKSNLLEALTIIFRDLDLGEPPTFSYELGYYCRDYHIKIIANKNAPSKDVMKILVKDEKKAIKQQTLLPTIDASYKDISYFKFKQDAREKYLPNYVFGYYSGPSNRMEQHFKKHQERFYHALIDGEEKPIRPLLYARLVHSQFVLLAFFSEHDPEIQNFLNEYLWIQGLDSVLFVMRQPPKPFRGGDPRFWYARGAVMNFLDKLYEFSLAPLRIKRRVEIEFMSESNLEHLYLYIKDPATLQKLATIYPSQQDFFKALESTYISKVISEVRIKVKIRNMDGSLTFRELSEGEQQLLMVLGLLRFTKEDESLFLLDEPDTHLNPAWSLQYIDFLKRVVGNQDTSHIIMTTHDPLTIAGLKKEQVQIIQRKEESGEIEAQHPEYDPRGMGVAALLTSDIYGLRSSLDNSTMDDLDEKRQLEAKAASGVELSTEEINKLKYLTDLLWKIDMSKTARDPLYEPFVRAMAQALEDEKMNVPVLTPEQQERQRELSLEIVTRLKSQQEKSE